MKLEVKIKELKKRGIMINCNRLEWLLKDLSPLFYTTSKYGLDGNYYLHDIHSRIVLALGYRLPDWVVRPSNELIATTQQRLQQIEHKYHNGDKIVAMQQLSVTRLEFINAILKEKEL